VSRILVTAATVAGLAILGIQAVLPSSAIGSGDLDRCYSFRDEGDVTANRLAGANRYETAVCISRRAWERSWTQTVVLARGDKYPDALAGAPLAANYRGPLLLTNTDAMPEVVLDEIQRILVPGRTVYLLGGTSAISDEVRSTLDDLGYRTERIAGADRYETAIEIAKRLPTSNFFFATGTDYPDALAAGNAAAAFTSAGRDDNNPGTRPYAILLTAGGEVTEDVADFARQRANVYSDPIWFTVGGWADRAASKVFEQHLLADRFVGTNRYDTAAQVAEIFFDLDYPYRPITSSHPPIDVTLTTGTNFPDALAAAGTLGGAWEFPLILVQNYSVGDHGAALLNDQHGTVKYLWTVGGLSTVRESIVDEAIQILE